MEIFLEVVRNVKPLNIKVNNMQGKPHDFSITLQRKMKGTQLDAVVFAQSMASLWSFSTYEVNGDNGYWVVNIIYKVKIQDTRKFNEIMYLQLREDAI